MTPRDRAIQILKKDPNKTNCIKNIRIEFDLDVEEAQKIIDSISTEELRNNSTENSNKDNENEDFWNTFDSLPCKDILGTRKEVKHLAKLMQSGEELKALASGLMDGNTWLIACTNMRVIFLDAGIIYGLKQMEIPIRSINSIDQKLKILSGEIHIQDGASSRKIENVSKSTIPFFVQKVNEQITLSQQAFNKPVSIVNTTSGNLDEIKKLKELLDMDAITQEEFDKKKKQLLEL